MVDEFSLLLSSPAKRARQTAEFFSNALRIEREVVDDRIYHAWPEDLVEVVREIPEESERVLIFGHNPGFTDVYNRFSVNSLDNLPTCGIFELICDGKWSEMSRDNTTTGILIYPKMFD